MRCFSNFILIGSLILGGCSVYKSKGRTQFEGRAPDNLKNGLVGQCWRQPKNEALWQSGAGITRFTVESYAEDNSIEVCAADVSTVDHPHSRDDVAGPLGR